MFKITVWTAFGVPSSRTYDTRSEAEAWGRYCLAELGCVRFTIQAAPAAAAIA
jgi:hypothetical protein